MARNIQSRLRIKGTLNALTPLHVGGYGDSPDTDLPLARNGKNEWYVPGTSLAGVLRAWCSNAFGNPITNELWGYQKDDRGHASFVLVEDAVVALPKGAVVEIRDGVGIDRVLGVAAESVKFDRAVLPRGSTLTLDMTVEIADQRYQSGETDEDFNRRVKKTYAIVGRLLNALQNGEIFLGAAHTRGLGRVKFVLDEKESMCQTLNTPEGMLEALEGKGVPISIANLRGQDQDIASYSRLDIAIRWHPKDALMVKSGYDGIGVDMLPLVSAKDHGVSLSLPGSSIKGALRSHAERIVRTLLDKKATHDEGDRQNFMKQLELPLIDELFGARSKNETQQTHKGLGALSVADCYAKTVMERRDWQAVEMAKADSDETFEKQEIWKHLEKLNQTSQKAKFEMTHHVAIDRWTGGAAEGALYSVLAPTKTEWEEISLTLDFTRLNGLQSPSIMLLLLVLRDLAANRLPLGFATNRGMGEIVVDRIALKGHHLDDILAKLSDIQLSGGKMTELDPELRQSLQEAWGAWIEKNHKEKAA